MERKLIYVITEHDHEDNERCVIGVADNLTDVDSIISGYYGGKFRQVSYHDHRDSGIEYTKTLEVLDHKNQTHGVTIIVEYFILNEL